MVVLSFFITNANIFIGCNRVFAVRLPFVVYLYCRYTCFRPIHYIITFFLIDVKNLHDFFNFLTGVAKFYKTLDIKNEAVRKFLSLGLYIWSNSSTSYVINTAHNALI